MKDNPGKDEIVIDLYSDWIGLLTDQLHKAGYEVDPKETPTDIAMKYFNVKLREIPLRQRTICKAKGLKCDPKWKPGLNEIERKASCGESLMPHLSKRLLDLNYNDPLLNDWGLHHLHLNTKIDATGFIERSGPLLFARVLPKAFYMVAVLEHGAWTDKSLMEQILQNWPHLLAPYEMKGLSWDKDSFDEKELAQLRKAHLQPMLCLSNHKVYMSPGGGVVTNGTNIRVVDAHDRDAEQIWGIEKIVKANYKTWEKQLPPGVKYGNPPVFKLILDAKGMSVKEQASGHICRFK